jgi:hypothetical protein
MVAILKICLILISVTAVWAQETGTEVNPATIAAVEVQDKPEIPSQ